MVTMRSRSEMKLESTFRNVVLPAPVPPETSMFSRAPTPPRRKSSIGWVSDCALDEIARAELVGAEAANRQHRPVEGQRRDDGVDARAVGQAGVDHRARFVDAPAHRADDPLDDAQQVLVVLEHERARFELALALHVDLVGAVDQDVRHRRVG